MVVADEDVLCIGSATAAAGGGGGGRGAYRYIASYTDRTNDGLPNDHFTRRNAANILRAVRFNTVAQKRDI